MDGQFRKDGSNIELLKILKQFKFTSFDDGIKNADQGSIHANLAVAHVAHALMSASPKQRNEWCKYVLNYAGATGEVSSVYVKVSE